MDGTLKLACLVIGAAFINLPLGYLRSAYDRLSFGWFFYVHISIPVIIYLRVKASLNWRVVPLTICGAVAGQLVGGMMRGKRGADG